MASEKRAPMDSAAGDKFFLAPLTRPFLARVAELEKASYPADEAASPEKLEYRLKNAGDFFCGLFRGNAQDQDQSPDALVGFICSTLALGELTEESMSQHNPTGTTLCIHSVVIDERYRRRKLSTGMLVRYVEHVQKLLAKSLTVEKTALICKENLIPLYSGVGFQLEGPSKVCHGKDPWFDMSLVNASWSAPIVIDVGNVVS
ncbi:unnamed protein product [Amoebophrya sp. A25]|nr:unnamed protein product [Amoebophrya sp. A25]|eukprot:GSA25T00010093001.1